MTLPKNRGIDKDRMRIDKNIPNYLTILRIVAIPLIVMSFYFEDSKFAHRFGGIIFAAASLTDFFDGYLARKYNIVSFLIGQTVTAVLTSLSDFKVFLAFLVCKSSLLFSADFISE